MVVLVHVTTARSRRATRTVAVAALGTVPRLTRSPGARRAHHPRPTPGDPRPPLRFRGRPRSIVRCAWSTRSPARISPKSVDASGTGPRVRAEHDVPPHDDRVRRRRRAREDDPRQRRPRGFGIPGHPGLSRGAPVEGAVSPDHRFFYVTNYSMYGAGFGPEGTDNCTGPGGLSTSFLYRVELKRSRSPGDPGRDGPEVRRGLPRQPLHPRDELVLVRPVGHRPRDVPGDPPHPARHRSAWHRGQPVVELAYIAVMGTSDVAASTSARSRCRGSAASACRPATS